MRLAPTAKRVVTLASVLLTVAFSGIAPSTAGVVSRLPGEYGTVWVTDRVLNNVSAFDAGTGDVLATIPVGSAPIGITAPFGKGKVYTSDEGSNQVSVISRRGRRVVKTIATGPRPHHMSSSLLGDRVYVAEFGSNTIGMIDTATDTKVATFMASPRPDARTHAVYPSRDGRTLYATNEVTNDIGVIDVRTGALLWNLPVGARPSEILPSPDGRRAYVSVRNENKLKEIDLIARQLTGREVTIGVQPDTLQLSPDMSTLSVALRGTPAKVALLDTSTFTFTTVDAAATTTGHQWVSRSGRYTFVALEGPPGVGVIDNDIAQVVATYPYPLGGQPPSASRPHGVFYDPLPLWIGS